MNSANVNDERIRQQVREGYGKIAASSGSCCGDRPTCCGSSPSDYITSLEIRARKPAPSIFSPSDDERPSFIRAVMGTEEGAA